jgi:hypothetical protein
VYNLAIYTAKPGRATERYARTTQLPHDSDEMQVLMAKMAKVKVRAGAFTRGPGANGLLCSNSHKLLPFPTHYHLEGLLQYSRVAHGSPRYPAAAWQRGRSDARFDGVPIGRRGLCSGTSSSLSW